MHCLRTAMISKSFLFTLILFSIAKKTNATFTNVDCENIKANNTQCDCSYTEWGKVPRHEIRCSVSESVTQIIVDIFKTSYSVEVEIVCNDIDDDLYKLLPRMDIGAVHDLLLSHWPLASGPISLLLHHLGIKKLEKVFIRDSDQHITRKHLSGLPDLKSLTLQNTNLQHTSDDIFVDLPNLTDLAYQNENVQLAPNIFAALENLRFLQLLVKNFGKLPADIFRYQSKLEVLTMQNSEGLNISRDLFFGATSVSILDLSYNRIESFQSDVFTLLTNLTEIDIRYNDLRELPSKIFSCNKKLTKVNISNNRLLKALPMGLLANLNYLRTVEIIFGNNLLNEDIYELHKEKKLPKDDEKIIHINCGLNEIPADIFANSVYFTKISLSRNEFGTVSASLFDHQFNLSHLYMSHNKLHSLPDELFLDTILLKVLNLSNNQLAAISSKIFSSLKYLEALYLDNNRLTTISTDSFVGTKNLRFITMENNLLHFSDSVKKQKESNTFNDLKSPFQFLENLQILNLRNNRFCYIFSDWTKMVWLKELDLSYNYITSLNHNDLDFHSNNEPSINLNHNQIRKIYFQNISLLVDSFISKTSFQLNNNPLDCDCNLLQIVRYVRGKLHYANLSLKIDELVCDKPEHIKYLNVRNVDPKELLCLFVPHCPHDCTCWERTYDSVLLVNCSGNSLQEVPILPRVQPLALKSIVLHIENNKLRMLPIVSTDGYADVTEIHAAGNNLTEIDEHNLPPNLTYIDLSHNKFRELNIKVQNLFIQGNTPGSIALSGNPWNCECKNQPLVLFVTKSNSIVSDSDNINCSYPINQKMTEYLIDTYNDLCQDEQFVLIALFGSILTSFFIIALIAALYYKYKIEVKIVMYKYRICSCLVNEEEMDKNKTYDAFISYSHIDEEFIAKHLVPELEEGPIRFKLCIHVRDFVVGECIPDQIARAIDTSRRTIIVLSENFINSVWAQLEFRMAHQAGLNEGRARLIIIVYGKIEEKKSLDEDLKAYLNTTTYLEWDNPWFWERLRYAMPHPSKKLNNDNGNMELNEFKMSREAMQ